MAKRTRRSIPSKRERLEAKQNEQAQRNRLIMAMGGIMALVIIALVVWQLWPQPEPEPEVAETALTGERPLASLAPEDRDGYFNAYPDMVIDTSNSYEAVFTTEKGEMRFELFDNEAPLTVNNFVFLANQGYYDGTTFHRVLADFMAQGGDPSGSGGGGPGYQFEDETDNGLTFDRRGLLAMANAGPNTNGSQFFITFAPTPHLNGAHTIFGELIEGDDVLGAISLRSPGPGAPPGDVIETIEIIEE